jgi:hypothetical protein
MIRREMADGYFLIAQHDHALLSGELARRVGNAGFDRPEPWERVCRAIAEHDCGWRRWDDRPGLNEAGLPVDVFETPVEVALAAWSESVEQVMRGDAYGGLLVSLHVLALSALAAGPDGGGGHHPLERTPRQTFELNKFQHRQIEIQESLRRQMGMRTDLPLKLGVAAGDADPREGGLERNLRVLQAMDAISLGLCCTHAPVNETAPLRPKDGRPRVALTIQRKGEDLTVEPWPFDREVIHCRIAGRRMPRQTWKDAAAFGRAFLEAPVEGKDVKVMGQSW